MLVRIANAQLAEHYTPLPRLRLTLDDDGIGGQRSGFVETTNFQFSAEWHPKSLRAINAQPER